MAKSIEKMSLFESMQSLKSYVDRVRNVTLREACESLLDNKRFANGFGSADHHHAYAGGLLVHTAEVMQIAVAILDGTSLALHDDSLDVVVTAVLFHDCAKVLEYKLDDDGVIQKTDYRKLIRHVAGSYAIWGRYVERCGGVDPELAIRIGHAMLAHHGRYEWGSPVEPQTVEAQIIHYADNLSARYGKGAFL